MREIRFSLRVDPHPPANSWAGWPRAAGGAPFVALQVQVAGTPDPTSGYLCNIQQLDRLVRGQVIPALLELGPGIAGLPAERLVTAAWDCLRPQLPPGIALHELRLLLTPYVSFTRHSGAPPMISVTEVFEFSAAHRLYCPQYSDAHNQELFGKCANPNGHGHNYQLEVTVSGEPQPDHGTVIALHDLETVVRKRVIERFDHKHLNLDCPEFSELNPSVEHIAAVIWGLLDGQLPPATLTRVRLWETPKTCAEIERPGV